MKSVYIIFNRSIIKYISEDFFRAAQIAAQLNENAASEKKIGIAGPDTYSIKCYKLDTGYSVKQQPDDPLFNEFLNNINNSDKLYFEASGYIERLSNFHLSTIKPIKIDTDKDIIPVYLTESSVKPKYEFRCIISLDELMPKCIISLDELVNSDKELSSINICAQLENLVEAKVYSELKSYIMEKLKSK